MTNLNTLEEQPHIANAELHTLASGVRVLLDPMPSLHSATINIWIDSSKSLPDPFIPGRAHFVEHMLFKGTSQQSAQNILQTIEGSGGTLNAITDKETTCFYARVLSPQVSNVLNTLCDMILHPIFKPSDIKTEQEIISHEIEASEGNPEGRLLERFTRTIWSNHPLSTPVIGRIQDIQQLTQQDLIDYHQTFYQPEHIVISIAGHFDTNAVLETLNQQMGSTSSFPQKSSLKTSQQTRIPYTQAILHEEDSLSQSRLIFGSPGPVAGSDKRFTLAIIDNLLGGGMDNKLFQALRVKQGSLYQIQTFELLYRNTGLFGIFAQAHPNQLDTIYDTARTLLDTICNEGFTAEELQQAQQKIVGNLLLNMESTRYRAARNARNMIYHGKVRPIARIQDKIRDITLKEIHTLSETLLSQATMSVLTSGPQSPTSLKNK